MPHAEPLFRTLQFIIERALSGIPDCALSIFDN